ncbi:ABC transporter permease [Candidatus Gracilibacteria bacterium]|nr:ABC transporter permease [Candidatus Gracilibacteria bacterium]
MLNLIGTWTLFKRETQRFLKVYLQTLAAPIVSNLLYFAIFGLGVSQYVPDIDGITYLQFLVPGLIIMGIINSAFQNPSSSIIIMKYQGLIDNLLTVPLRKGEILLAFTASAVLRGLLVGLMTYLTAIFFVDLPYTSVSLIFLTSTLIALFFSFLGIIVGIWANSFDRTAFIASFILQPLIFLGGVFYSIKNLPPLAQQISAFNPIVYMVDLMRYSFTGLLDHNLTISLLIVSATTFLLGLISYLLLRSGWRMEG